MNLRPIVASEQALPLRGNWLHVISRGEELTHRVKRPDGKFVDLVEVRDDECIRRLLLDMQARKAAAGFSGLLLDIDHESETGGSTIAYGWLMDCREVADGLEYLVDFSDIGLAAVNGKRLKFASGSFDPESECEIIGPNRLRPVAMSRAALTNDPRSKKLRAFGQNFLNRAAHGASAEEKGEGMDYKAMLLKLLGAPADATDEQLKSLCDGFGQETMKSRGDQVTALTARNAELAASLVEGDLVEFASVIKDREGTKAQLLKDRAGTLVVLRGLNTGGDGKLLSRKDTKVPAGQEIEEDRRSQERESFVDTIQKSHGLKSRADAMQIAATEKPHLFGVAKK